MSRPDNETVTQLLDAVRGGSATALNDLLPMVYDELRILAGRVRRDWERDYTVNTTALMHEAYLKLIDQTQVEWNDRGHFFAVAAVAMRHILINYAQRSQAQKRGGDVAKVSLEAMRQVLGNQNLDFSPERDEVLLLLDESLSDLEKYDGRLSRIVECRFFGGMTVEETAEALGVSGPTVKRGWAVARAWLYREMLRRCD